MCLTLPEVLISVVGIEKVVPTWEDLDPLLRLLPRSSTGERMNPYTSTWTGVTPGDGPQEVHVVLLDNGRTNALADDVGRQALRCIRCSACLNVCPVYERVGGHAYGSVYPGPIGAILNPLLNGVCGPADRLAAVRLLAVRRLLRGLPGAASTSRRCSSTSASQVVDGHRGDRVPKPEALAMRAAAYAFSDARRLAWAERASGLAGRVMGRFGRTTLPGGRRGRRPAPRPRGRLDVGPRPARAARASRSAPGGSAPTEGPRDDRAPATRSSAGSAQRWSTSRRPSQVPPAPRVAPGGRPGRPVRRAGRGLPRHGRRAAPRPSSPALVAAAARRGVGGRARRPRGSTVPGAVVDAGLSAHELDAIDAVVTARPRRHRRDRHDRPRPRPPARAAARSRWCPTCTCASSRADQVVADVPDAIALLDPTPAADLDQRTERDQRHRARPGRGRARAAHPARGRGGRCVTQVCGKFPRGRSPDDTFVPELSTAVSSG